VVEFGGLPLSTQSERTQIVLARPAHALPPLNFRMVWFAPAPRNVTLLFVPKVTWLERLYVPALRKTTCPLGQAAMALLI